MSNILGEKVCSLQSEMTKLSPFAALILRNFPPGSDEELFEDIDDAGADTDNKDDECSK